MKAEEPEVVYMRRNPLSAYTAARYKTKVIPIYQWSSFEKIGVIKEGISKEELENFKNAAELDYDTLSRLLNVARATLLNKKGNAKFDATTSEKIFHLADIYSYGYGVFESRAGFNRWMKSENRALGGASPLSMLDTMYGIQEIKNLIGRIEYGVYS